MRNDSRLLSKKFTIVNYEKVNTVTAQGATYRAYESELKEEAKYQGHQLATFLA